MRRVSIVVLVLLAALVTYSLLWPVPIDPALFVPADNPGMTGVYAPNTALASTEHITPGIGTGPEDVTRGPDGLFCAAPVPRV